MKKQVKVERGADGYAAAFSERGFTIVGTGNSLAEIEASLQDGIDSAASISTDEDLEYWKQLRIELSLDVPSIFAHFGTLNVKAFAERIGMNRSLLQQYVSGKKMPGETQSIRILKGINDLGREYLALKV
ncbi:MAG: hypothetical protein JSS84_04850 [Bacteroidetes bacterium]|nr:hypothetical protein [Bacteroidota bacterium]